MALFQLVTVASDNSANATTTNLNPNMVQSISAPTASEIVNFPTALTAVTYVVYEQNTPKTRRLLSSTALATVLSAVSSASSGVLGGGVSGQTTLVAGTKAITISGLTTSSIALVTLVSSLTGSSTVTYQAVCTANTLTLRANVAAGTINTADVSILNYAIVG